MHCTAMHLFEKRSQLAKIESIVASFSGREKEREAVGSCCETIEPLPPEDGGVLDL